MEQCVNEVVIGSGTSSPAPFTIDLLDLEQGATQVSTFPAAGFADLPQWVNESTFLTDPVNAPFKITYQAHNLVTTTHNTAPRMGGDHGTEWAGVVPRWRPRTRGLSQHHGRRLH